MEAQNLSDQGQDGLAENVMQSLGEAQEASSERDDESTPHEEAKEDASHDPLYVQKRLKQQKRAHEREIRELHARIGDLQSRIPNSTDTNQTMNPYSSNSPVDEQIHKAVSYALQHKEMEERKAKDAEKYAHVQKQYGELQKHLDSTADRYEDFDDVVRSQDAPYTTHMRDAALFLPRSGPGSAGEVLYKLGKNPSELDRISKLHPLDQASEMVKLSHALISGGENKSAPSRPLGNIKSNPVTNSHAVTEKTPIGSIRERMKSGSWK